MNYHSFSDSEIRVHLAHFSYGSKMSALNYMGPGIRVDEYALTRVLNKIISFVFLAYNCCLLQYIFPFSPCLCMFMCDCIGMCQGE